NCLLVLLEFAFELISNPEKRSFRHWKLILEEGVKPAHFEQYFIGLARVGGRQMLKDALLPLEPYLRWGYLAREVMIDKHLRPVATRIRPLIREQVLQDLLK